MGASGMFPPIDGAQSNNGQDTGQNRDMQLTNFSGMAGALGQSTSLGGQNANNMNNAPRPLLNTDDKNEQSIFGIRASKNQSNAVQSVARKLENSVKTIERIVNDLKSRVKDQDRLIGSTV